MQLGVVTVFPASKRYIEVFKIGCRVVGKSRVGSPVPHHPNPADQRPLADCRHRSPPAANPVHLVGKSRNKFSPTIMTTSHEKVKMTTVLFAKAFVFGNICVKFVFAFL